jgi:hypothetical protein
MTGTASPKGERSESIDDPFPSLLFRFPLHRPNCIVGTACLTKSVAVVAENRFIDRCQDLGGRLLNDAIKHRRNAERAFRAIRFRNFNASNRRGRIRPVEQFSANSLPVLAEKIREFRDFHAVDSGRSSVLPHSFPSSKQVFAGQNLFQ